MLYPGFCWAKQRLYRKSSHLNIFSIVGTFVIVFIYSKTGIKLAATGNDGEGWRCLHFGCNFVSSVTLVKYLYIYIYSSVYPLTNAGE